MPNLISFLDNVNSEDDGCSDVEEDCIPIEDSMLDVSVIQDTTTHVNHGKRTRVEANLSPVREDTHRVQGIRQRTSPTPGPSAPSSSNGSDLTLTCKDGTVFQMAEFMKLMMEQLKTTNKVLSKGEECESTKRLRLAEAEVI